MELSEFITKFAEALEIEDASNLNVSTNFHELDEWNSLTVLSVIAMFDEEYEVEVSGVDIRKANTLGDLYSLVKEKA